MSCLAIACVSEGGGAVPWAQSGKATQDSVQDKLPFSLRFPNCETEPSCTDPRFV